MLMETQLEDFILGLFVTKSVRRNEQLFIIDIVIVLDSKRNPLRNFNGTHLKINITE